jgi:hypothetical protein
LWGGSHAFYQAYFFDKLGKALQVAIHDVAFTLCPPLESEPRLPGDTTLMQSHLQCVQHDQAVMDYIMSRSDIKTVFISSAWQNYKNLAVGANVQTNDHGFMPGQLETDLGNTIGKLTAAESMSLC